MRPRRPVRPRPRRAVTGALSTAIPLAATALAAAGGADEPPQPMPISVDGTHLRVGHLLTVRGRTDGGDAGRPVELQLAPPGLPWRTVAHASVTGDGSWRVHAPMRSSALVRTVLTPPGAGAQAPFLRVSGARAVTVDASIAVGRRRLDVLTGHPAAVQGVLRPGRRGRRVQLQVRRHGSWHTLAHTTTRGRGRFSLTARTGGATSLPVRLRFGGDALNGPARRTLGRLNVYRVTGASWYALIGGHLACGGTLGPGTLGVANRTLPCGTAVVLRYHRHRVRTHVIDRGPFVSSREWDLTSATADRLGFHGAGAIWSTE